MRFEPQRRDAHPAVLVEQVGLHAYGLEAHVVQPLQRLVFVCVGVDTVHEKFKRALEPVHLIPDRLPRRRIVVVPIQAVDDRLQFFGMPRGGVDTV
tara:strand:+ start:1043 stop:1330 length:288 start_codon:yes stop_codon:yes gene_type:complete